MNSNPDSQLPRSFRRSGYSLHLRQWATKLLPSRLLDAIHFARTPDWRRKNSLDDEAARAVIRACVLRGDGIFVDVGAHGGEVLRAAIEAYPQGIHHAFEPGLIARELKSQFPSVKVHECCVGASTTQVDYFVYKRSTRSSTKVVIGEELVEIKKVPQVSLDEFLGDGERVSVIKIDVEGAELEVLVGAYQLMTNQAPVLLFEHGSPNGGLPQSTSALYDLLDSLHYRIAPVRGEVVKNFAEFRRIVESGTAWNFLAVVESSESLARKG